MVSQSMYANECLLVDAANAADTAATTAAGSGCVPVLTAQPVLEASVIAARAVELGGAALAGLDGDSPGNAENRRAAA